RPLDGHVGRLRPLVLHFRWGDARRLSVVAHPPNQGIEAAAVALVRIRPGKDLEGRRSGETPGDGARAAGVPNQSEESPAGNPAAPRDRAFYGHLRIQESCSALGNRANAA